MFPKLVLITTLISSFISSSIADGNTSSRVIDGVGVSIQLDDGASITPGFFAKFYDYPLSDFILLSNDDWIAGSYSTKNIRTTASAITSPNFSFESGNYYQMLYGINDVDMTNVLLELKGYFARMFT